MTSLHMMFDGRLIEDNDTPQSLEMEDEDWIEVYQEPGARECMERRRVEREAGERVRQESFDRWVARGGPGQI